MTTSVILCSGGIDSVTAAALMRQQGHDVTLLHIDYGQITFPAERRSVQQSAAALCFRSPVNLRVADLACWGEGTLVGREGVEDTSEWFPHRNLFLAACGVIVASSLGARSVVCGVIDASHALYTDCQWPFLKSCAETIQTLAPTVQFLSPLAHMTKQEVVQLAAELHVPLGFTFSCNTRNDRHCWQCAGCFERNQAFHELGIDL